VWHRAPLLYHYGLVVSILSIVDVMCPTAATRVCDPAAGTGGFLLEAYEHMKSNTLDPDEKRFLRDDALRGWEIVDATARLCAMNLLLHGIGTPQGESLITVDDSLRTAPSEHFDMVLTNSPFGKKSSYKVINAEGDAEREDMSYLRLFFDRKPPSERPWTQTLWIYDLRTNQHFTLKERQLTRDDLDDFVTCYNPNNRYEWVETERFRPITHEALVARDKASLDIFWLRDDSLEDADNLPAPHIIVAEIGS